MTDRRVVIIGTGAAGLGAAFRLYEQGYRNFLVLERGEGIAENIKPVTDEKGFIWDPAGRGISARNGYFSELMKNMCEPWTQKTRPSMCLLNEHMIPNPVQRNIQHLPPDMFLHFLRGMIEASKHVYPLTNVGNLHQWLMEKFGEQLTEEVFVPFAMKRWGCHPSRLEADWAANKIAAADYLAILTDTLSGTNEKVDAVYMYPSSAYSSSMDLWESIHHCIPDMFIRFNSRVVAIAPNEKEVVLEDGTKESYDVLISTMPLDQLCSIVQGGPAVQLDRFKHASTHFVGIGVQGQVPEHLADKSWIYCTGEDVPFFRVTIMSNYSRRSVPAPDTQWSLLCETCDAGEHKVDADTIIDETIRGLIKIGFVASADDVIDRHHWRQEYGTPLPFLGRTEVVHRLDAQLSVVDIHSIGRLGAWNYELSGVSDSFLQGVRCVDNLIQREDQTLNVARAHVPSLAPMGRKWQEQLPAYVILVDMDNTLCNYEEAFERTMRQNFPHIDIVPQSGRKHWHIELDYPEEHRQQVVSINSIPGFFRNMKPNEYGCEALREMLAEGLEVFIVTAPDPVTTAQCVAEKVLWVEEYLGHEWKDRLILTRDKTTISGDVLIDDKPTCHIGRANPGWKHVFYHQMYNADCSHRRRIQHWRDWRQVLYPRLSRRLPATLYPDEKIALSFVVTTHNAGVNQLHKTLDAILVQTANMNAPYEVVLIDDHTCSLNSTYLKYRDKCDLRLINEIPSGMSSAINTGVEAAKYPYIIVAVWYADFSQPSMIPKIVQFLSASNHSIPYVFATDEGVTGFPKLSWQSLPEGRARVAPSAIMHLFEQDGCTRVDLAQIVSDTEAVGTRRL